MRSAEMISRVAIAGGLLGAVGGGIDLATNPGIQKLKQERQAIVQQYDWGESCNSRACVDIIVGDTPEQQKELTKEYNQKIDAINNDPLNKKAFQQETVDQLLTTIPAFEFAGIAMKVLLDEEKKKPNATQEKES